MDFMKDKLITLTHIIVLIIIYILSFIVPGAISKFIEFQEPLKFIRIILQSFMAILIFFFSSKLYVEKVMKLKLPDLRVKFKKPEIHWLVAAIVVPVLVLLFYFYSNKAILIQGKSDINSTIRVFVHSIFIAGLCAGIVEEIFFRGILLGYLEKKYGIKYAILIPSLLFGAPHLLSVDIFSVSLIIQVTVFITFYGIIMSLIVYYTNNIWNTISIHIMWNAITTSLIIKQGEIVKSNFVLQLKGESLFWYGGDYDIDVSIVGLVGLSIFGFMFFLFKRKNLKAI
jgi:membrane protease YdiL (CAAX protease family)